MRAVILVLLLSSVAVCASTSASRFDPNGYQFSDGAISLHHRGDYIEPYFATKALILAQEAGLDVRGPAERGIQWLLPRQEKNGSFGRYCPKVEVDRKLCAPAVAEDP